MKLTRKKGRGDECIEIVGTPDLVLEIVSDSSARKDLVRLKQAYFRAGVSEYWPVDARGSEVRFQILRRKSDGYGTTASAFESQASGVLGARLALSRTRNRLGRFTYRLAVTRR